MVVTNFVSFEFALVNELLDDTRSPDLRSTGHRPNIHINLSHLKLICVQTTPSQESRSRVHHHRKSLTRRIRLSFLSSQHLKTQTASQM